MSSRKSQVARDRTINCAPALGLFGRLAVGLLVCACVCLGVFIPLAAELILPGIFFSLEPGTCLGTWNLEQKEN